MLGEVAIIRNLDFPGKLLEDVGRTVIRSDFYCKRIILAALWIIDQITR